MLTATIALLFPAGFGLLATWSLVVFTARPAALIPSAALLSALGSTLLVATISLVFALPIAFAGAIYVALYASRRLARSLVLAVELLSALPAVLWAFVAAKLAPSLLSSPYLVTGFAVGVMLAPRILLRIAQTLRDAPREIHDNALALGARPWDIFRLVLWPHARASFLSVATKAYSRAIGEAVITAAVFHAMARGQASPLAATLATPFFGSSEGPLGDFLTTAAWVFGMTFGLNALARRWAMRPTFLTAKFSVWASPWNSRAKVASASALFALGLPVLLVPISLWQSHFHVPWDVLTVSVWIVIVSSLLALPLGLGSAIHVFDHREGAVARSTHHAVELLGGTPPVVIGAFAFALSIKMGIGNVGACILSLLLVSAPALHRRLVGAFDTIPTSYSVTANALGMPRPNVWWGVLLPTAKRQIVGALIHSLSRTFGSTAPLLMIAARDPHAGGLAISAFRGSADAMLVLSVLVVGLELVAHLIAGSTR